MCLSEQVTELQAQAARASVEHHRLVWVAGGSSLERSSLLKALAETEDGAFVEIGKILSSAIIEIPAPLRPASVEECFAAILSERPAPVVCLDHLEILFESSLRLNPVELIKGASRHRLLVASWPGTTQGNRFCFGPDDHPAHLELSEQDFDCRIFRL